jgi:hypothetical protein
MWHLTNDNIWRGSFKIVIRLNAWNYCNANYIYTHYIHSVVVHYFVSGRACCVNQARITTSRDSDELWCGLFTQQARPAIKSCINTLCMYMSLSNISIKTNFKQITRVELKCVHYSQGDYILRMTSRYVFRSFTNARLLCFVSHSNDMTSCQSSSAENIACKVAPFFYHHSVVIQYLISDTLYQTGYFL